jgi:hypothetical protein
LGAAGRAVEDAVVRACAEARAPRRWSDAAPWARDNFGLGLCGRADPTWALQACAKLGARGKAPLAAAEAEAEQQHRAAEQAAAAAAAAAASSARRRSERPATASGGAASPPAELLLSPAAGGGIGGRRSEMTRAALEARSHKA